MRRIEKKLNMSKVNMLSESRYMETKMLKEMNKEIYFETLSEALEAVREKAKSLGYEADEDALFTNFGTGGISYETTKSAIIPLLKDGQPILDKRGKEMNRNLSVSIYRMPSGRYELTLYKTY